MLKPQNIFLVLYTEIQNRQKFSTMLKRSGGVKQHVWMSLSPFVGTERETFITRNMPPLADISPSRDPCSGWEGPAGGFSMVQIRTYRFYTLQVLMFKKNIQLLSICGRISVDVTSTIAKLQYVSIW